MVITKSDIKADLNILGVPTERDPNYRCVVERKYDQTKEIGCGVQQSRNVFPKIKIPYAILTSLYGVEPWTIRRQM